MESFISDRNTKGHMKLKYKVTYKEMNDDDEKLSGVDDRFSLRAYVQAIASSRKDDQIWTVLLLGNEAALKRIVEIDPDIVHARGYAGECPIHKLVLYGTETHIDMAKYLITKFPSIIMQSYTNEAYRGEIALHIAIINKNLAMVEWLLGNKINEAHRDDQLRAKATGNLFSKGQPMYFGETPLGFACCTNQWDIVNILLKYGADMDVVDSNGNTILHLLVIHSRRKMYIKFKKRWEEVEREKTASTQPTRNSTGESSDTNDDDRAFQINNKDIPIWERRNKAGHTPLTLAAKLGNWKMLSFLIEERKIIQWTYGYVASVLYPLKDLDTEIGCENKETRASVLELIIQNADVQCIKHELLVHLLNRKWKCWARRILLQRLMVALVYLTIFVLTIILDQTRTEMAEGDGVEMIKTSIEDPGGIHKIAIIIGRFIVLAGALWKCKIEIDEMVKMGIRSHFKTAGAILLENLMAFAWCVCIISANILRFFGMSIETPVLAIAAIIGWGYMLFFLMPFRLTGPFVVMIYKMLVTDVLRFCIIYAVFLVGFSQAFFILEGYNGFGGFALSVKECFFSMLGDIDVDNYTETNYQYISFPLLLIYIFTVTILLINMLIAMMGNTYQQVIENATEIWQLHRARIICTLEKEMPAEVLFQRTYKYWVNVDGERYIQAEEINDNAFDDDDDDNVQDDSGAHDNSKDIKEDTTTEDVPVLL